jgi:uncharacterized protein YebE (UPF0316 family)
VCLVIIDDREHFINLFVDLPNRVNDSKIPKKFAFYYQASYHGFFFVERGQENVEPYLLKNKGYPIFSWLMTLHNDGKKKILEILYNNKYK